jgi:chloride channel protein, CIC family
VTLRSWQQRTRFRITRASNQQLARAVWLGLIIGVIAGVAAILFIEAIDLAGDNLLGRLAGYHPPEPLGEGEPVGSGPDRLWALPLVLALGGLLSGVIVSWLAPEARGAGADPAIYAFHHEGGRMRARVIPIKLLASAITIGSGGAAGREGPTAQIGGGIGSVIAQQLGLGAVERRRALVAGMGAGIGAIFRAPLGGAMIGAEMLYKHDFEADAVLMALISSIVAYSIFGSYAEFEPIFGGASGFAFSRPEELPYYAGLGVICGLLGLLYARSFHGTTALFDGFKRLPMWAKPAIGGFIVGSIGMAAPEAIHVGYGWVQQAFTEEGVNDFPLLLLVALPFLRILTTSLTVGSGASGGIFGPGMVIGGLTGAALWRLGQDLPGFPQDPGAMVIIGMIAMFGAIAHTPLAMLLMVAEMTGNLSLLAPAMVAVAIATLLVGDNSIYRHQVDSRADSPAHRDRFAFPLLNALPSHRAVIPTPILAENLTPQQALDAMTEARVSYGVVVDGHGKILGEVDHDTVRGAVETGEVASIARLTRPVPAVVLADMPLDQAMDLLTNHERRWLPVTDGEDGPVLGSIDARALMRSYRRAVRSQIRPLTPVTEDVHSLEVVLPEESPLAGVALSDAELPPGVRLLTIARDGSVLVPHGGTILQAGDTVTITFPAAQRRNVFSLLLGS